jgi:Skp family chaperone for outer membrane proteins
MKTFAKYFFILIFSVSATAQIEEQKAALEKAVDNYGKVYGAWLVEKQCAYLTDAMRKQLENDLHTIQEAIPQDPAIQNMHMMVEESAREVANAPPFSDCGKESEALVQQASSLATTWASIIRSGPARN